MQSIIDINNLNARGGAGDAQIREVEASFGAENITGARAGKM